MRRLPLLLLCTLAGCEAAIDVAEPWRGVDPGPGPSSAGGGQPFPGLGGGSAGGGDPVVAPAPLRFRCDPTRTAVDLPLRRLSKVQFQNTLRLALQQLAPTAASAALTAAAPKLALYPDDVEVAPNSFGAHGFTRSDQQLSQQQADALFAVARAVAESLASTSERRTAIFGPCASDGNAANDVVCARALIDRVGPRLLRGTLTVEQAALIASAADAARGDGGEAVVFADVLTALLAQPAFTFLVEGRGDGPSDPGARLTGVALASRLSFHLTNEPPDDALWAAATSGALDTEAGYEAQVDRLLADPRAQSVRDEFFDQWLWVSRGAVDLTDQLTVPAYRAVAMEGPSPTHDPRPGIVEDLLGAARHAFDTGGGTRALLTDTAVYARDPQVAALYGAQPWDGSSTAPAPGGSRRAGLITRIGFTANGRFETNPIKKGVRLRTAVLCDVLSAPPPGAANSTLMTTDVLSSRQKVEGLTEVSGSVCLGCHRTLINPLGYLTEDFDPLGRERTRETAYDDQGKALKSFEVKTAASPHVGGQESVAADAKELTERIAASGRFEACLSAQLFRFTAQKAEEDPVADGCRLAELETLARQGKSFKDVFKASVMSQGFRHRVTAP